MAKVLVATALLCLLLLARPSSTAIILGTYNIQPGSITTSGISSGAVMATQFHVIHSANVHGAGMFAGVPYGCSLGTVTESLICMQTPGAIIMLNLYARTNTYNLYNEIDPTRNLADDKVFIFHGTEDTVVRPGSATNLHDFYRNYGVTNFLQKIDLAAQHCMPTNRFGTTCSQLNQEHYINNCGYDGAYEMLNFFYGGLTRPTGNEAILSNLFEFDQSDFFTVSPPSLSSMDDIGYVYIPTACAGGAQCKLHIAFHGCQQGRVAIGTTYVQHAGYLETAERNNIIVLFPQAISNSGNPQGCWDWWGYNNALFDTRNGNQVVAVNRMVNRMTGGLFKKL